ncbi:hypothetical protein NPIL_608621 [Nephila pilipes]|uniref:Uncharacterized protein n=1 Tax=Nephila pilipes TaxID=299642 RepID=A0A8X6MLH3_NEPPI|nr:hypothetical protein NPIL_608621 [Nephila pilipes]
MATHPKNLENLQLKTKKEAVVHFRLKTGDDWLGEHLNRIGILDTNICPICKSRKINSDHPLNCTGLDRVAQEQEDLIRRSWETRNLMD